MASGCMEPFRAACATPNSTLSSRATTTHLYQICWFVIRTFFASDLPCLASRSRNPGFSISCLACCLSTFCSYRIKSSFPNPRLSRSTLLNSDALVPTPILNSRLGAVTRNVETRTIPYADAAVSCTLASKTADNPNYINFMCLSSGTRGGLIEPVPHEVIRVLMFSSYT
ncbi:hypothetical protein GGR57DRAFT_54682 [Xylariaceae sp. FL1272]|nr:hypothetical protein GGR57DRAFT_54682 [Xylariaceae sp. FL1272]